MKKWILMLLICTLLICVQSAFAREHNYISAVIDGKTADRVHLREGASTAAKSLGLYFTGTELLYEPPLGNEWVWVNVGTEGGYIKAEFLAESAVPKQPRGMIVNPNGSGFVNLRHEPSLNGAVFQKLNNGDTVTILGETHTNWYYVQSSEQTGYISAEFVQMGAWKDYEAVLQNEAPFVEQENGETRLGEWLRSFTDVAMEITQYAAVDLDGDGLAEMVLRVVYGGNDYGFMVLHEENGTVYGHFLAYRALRDLKADGTFSFSSGAADSGFGRLKLNKSTCTIETLPLTDKAHAAKTDVLWINYSNSKAPV